MARRSKPIIPSRRIWEKICVMCSPVVLLLGGLVYLSYHADFEAASRERAQRAQRMESIQDALGTAVIREIKPGLAEVELPADEALKVTTREATELALTVRSRLGGLVRVVTPARQVLAEAR